MNTSGRLLVNVVFYSTKSNLKSSCTWITIFCNGDNHNVFSETYIKFFSGLYKQHIVSILHKPAEKGDPGYLEKADPTQKIIVWIKNYFLNKHESVVSNIQYDTSLLTFYPKNTQIKHLCFQIWTFLFFHKFLHWDKFEGADFKDDNVISKFQT